MAIVEVGVMLQTLSKLVDPSYNGGKPLLLPCVTIKLNFESLLSINQ